MKTKKFTILHSNDMHGDFLSDAGIDKGKLIGGLALLSGYITKVRNEEENVLYVISGDMVQGSLIDSEYKGISTMEIMNYLSPDVVAIGNHEVDYGLPHLLFLEKIANFPIVSANLHIKPYGKRLLRSHVILKKTGFDILFTGIITEKIMDSIKMDTLIGSFITVEEASREVGRICNAYKHNDIDLTILLTHIGIESDRELAKLLKPEWGVDMIIGGHSHTRMEKPERVNNILIAQCGTGTDQIGRFDIVVDDDTNSIVSYTWKNIVIDGSIAPPDKKLEEYIFSFKKEVDHKYCAITGRFIKMLTHPVREEETELGNLVADIFAENAQSDVMLVGSGSIRVKELGPVVTLQDVLSCFPYDDSITRFVVSGKVLKKIFTHIMRNENRKGEGECYQVNAKIRSLHDDTKNMLASLTVGGTEVSDTGQYTIAMQNFHFNNCIEYLGVTQESLLSGGKMKVVTTSARDVLIEYLNTHNNCQSHIEGRMIYKKSIK